MQTKAMTPVRMAKWKQTTNKQGRVAAKMRGNWKFHTPALQCFSCALARAATTKSHSRGHLNNRRLFLTVLDTGKSKSKAPAYSVLHEGPCADGHLLAVPSHAREKKLGCAPSSHCSANPITGLHPMTSSTPKYLPKASPANSITSGVMASTYEFSGGGHKHSVHNISLENSLAVAQEVKYRVTTWPSTSTPQ